MGSVKDLTVLKEPMRDRAGIGQFIFSNRYSVFDWGEMPDHIVDKGRAICMAAAYFFERLEELKVKTHYIGLVEDGTVKRIGDLTGPTDTMEFKLFRVLRPRVSGGLYDYSIYKGEKSNFLIPLEVVYRNALPEGSSVFKRIRNGSLKLEDLGLDDVPMPGQVLEKPIIEVSTKLEASDRYISWEEAGEICGLSDDELEEIKGITLLVNRVITGEASRMGLVNEDGKVEFGFDEERSIVIVDAVGTLDECRFTFEGLPVSKELARMFYRKTEWYRRVEDAKGRDRVNWKTLVSAPPPMPAELVDLISSIYKAYANELTGKRWFDAPPLKETIHRVREFLG
ncbi:MAG: phosphoribosylaminoimidazolesuccinocarboxamide synthase [Candidatus Bathyarchaeia archaeon]|nr:phosphoribosylaminoimidazolesuccinocarboxamide synthase [Candidatus Bathyarchaeota archaeon]